MLCSDTSLVVLKLYLRNMLFKAVLFLLELGNCSEIRIDLVYVVSIR